MARTIPPTALSFLSKLKRNNRRDWFKPRKHQFEAECRDLVLAWFDELAPSILKLAPLLFVDASPSGGSLRRIYRDTRFGGDKQPYKTHLALLMPHVEVEGNLDAPCFYLQIAPGDSWFAAGLYGPTTAQKQRVRRAIQTAPDDWRRATQSPAFRRQFAWVDGSLKRRPRGVEADDPSLVDLMRQRWAVRSAKFDDSLVTDDRFAKTLQPLLKSAAPMVKFPSQAINLGW